ncbi:MAG: hypothetical protein JXR66_00135 [Bacteroidales bacterium]|nr:hypothetical protein [Bacteroidales bacterium]MBN2631931.1 hypothetical protein [Bacteroidales bacterium]
MMTAQKYDKTLTGVLSGIILPLTVALFIFIFAKEDPSPAQWLKRISLAGVWTHIISLCVFPNVIIFFIFNHFDMLRASRGVLGITIVWAVVVLLDKFV